MRNFNLIDEILNQNREREREIVFPHAFFFQPINVHKNR